MRVWYGFLVLIAFAITGAAAAAADDCAPSAGVEAICGLHSPEDIEVLPGGTHLLLSGFNAMGKGPGALYLFDIAARRADTLYPGADSPEAAAPWGDPACTRPPGAKISPHGIHLSRSGADTWRLLVVNHGGREAVEMFELRRAEGRWQARWRGCVPAPANALLNDVVALPQGGFVASNMFDPADATANERSNRGEDTGNLLRWTREAGFVALPGSAAPAPNGLQVDADGRYLFVNVFPMSEVRKFDLHAGRVVGRAHVSYPDNASWSPDGHLLVAGMTALDGTLACTQDFDRFCPQAYRITAVDPATLATREVFASSGPPTGAATIAVQVGRRLYVGSFAGRRLSIVDLAP
ncbi:MAG: SMP-30/gluconolactonase/LRE family protein [Gammaproteobacteria bacterium]